MTRACIYGAGAMGTVLGAFIAKSGKQIDLITRNRAHVEVLRAHGAHITGSVDFTVAVNALLPGEMCGRYDVIFLMTKQRGNAQTVAFLKDYLAEDGVICTTQNGLPEPSVAAIVGKDRCLGCAVSWGATFVGDGEARLTSSADRLTFALGSPFGDNEKTSLVKPLLDCMGEVSVESNFTGARWAKLIINSAFSSLSAVTGLTFGEVSRRHKPRRLAQAMLKEGMDVAFASHVTPAKIQGHDIVKLLGYNNPFKRALSYALIPLAMKKHEKLVSGMYYDLKNGKPCDIDFVSGVVKAYGEACGVPTPYTNRVIELAHRIERGECAASADNLKELE